MASQAPRSSFPIPILGRLFQRHDFNIARTAENINTDSMGVALQSKIDRRSSDLKVANLDPLQGFRKSCVVEIDARLPGADGETQAGL